MTWKNVSFSEISNVMDESGHRNVMYSADLQGKSDTLLTIYVAHFAVGFYGSIPLVTDGIHVAIHYISGQKYEWAGEVVINKSKNEILLRTYAGYPNPNTNFFVLNAVRAR